MSKQPEALAMRVREVFDYVDGILVHKVSRRCPTKIGKRAGSPSNQGYINVKLDGQMHKAHRLIFLMHHGYMPSVIDHIDGDKANNRIENLRACSKSENGMNRHHTYAKTQARNVYARSGGFYVALKFSGKYVYVGSFKSLDAANEAAIAARQQHYGEFA